MRIFVIGSGYVGLTLSATFAEIGHSILIYDIDADRIRSLQEGSVPFYEPGLEDLIKRHIETGRLKFTTKFKEGPLSSDIFFIAIPTPPKDDGSTDLDPLKKLAIDIGHTITRKTVIVLKSTVPPGTALQCKSWIEKNSAHEVQIISNPEFLQEGLALENSFHPHRVIIGHTSSDAAEKIGALYAPLKLQKEQILYMDPTSAEMAKYASNILLASKISLINEFANICEKMGANINYVKHAVSMDPRIGGDFLKAGLGFGGSCLPKDLSALTEVAKDLNVQTPILQAIHQVNSSRISHFFDKIEMHFANRDFKELTFSLWGLAFKAGTDDVRSSPGMIFLQLLLDRDCKIHAYDPLAMQNAQKHISSNNIHWHTDPYLTAEGSDGILITTELSDLAMLDFAKIKKSMKTPIIFDGRNSIDAKAVVALGYTYYGIGFNT